MINIKTYSNRDQIYTHSGKYGVIIGQVWKHKDDVMAYSVSAIVESGMVVLTPVDFLAPTIRVYILELINSLKGWQLLNPVHIIPHTQPDGKVYLQSAMANYNKMGKHRVVGVLSRDYV